MKMTSSSAIRDASGLEGGVITTRMREKKLMIKLIMYAHYTYCKMKQAGSILTVEKHSYMQEYF